MPRRFNPITFGIYLVAALLLANLVALLARNNGSTAFAQNQPPIAGGAGVFVMPAQMGPGQWGCYLLDVDSGTLCAYQYMPGERQIKFQAARDYRYDRKLRNYNCAQPTPDEVRELVEKELKARHAVEGAGDKSEK